MKVTIGGIVLSIRPLKHYYCLPIRLINLLTLRASAIRKEELLGQASNFVSILALLGFLAFTAPALADPGACTYAG
jgi:hypothetical protein